MNQKKSIKNSSSIITTQAIEDVVNNSSSDRVPIRDVIEAMESIGFGLVFMIFSVGIIIPTPPPFPSIISMPLVVFSFQMLLGYQGPRLPKKFFGLSVKRSVLIMLIQKSSSIIRIVEKFLKHRFGFMFSKIGDRITGFFSLLFSSFILLPIPLSNYVPGVGILMISFGLLAKDGLVIILGIFTGCLGVGASVYATFTIGSEFIKYLKGFF